MLPRINAISRKPSGTAVKPTAAATRVPKRSVKRPASGTSTIVSSGSDPTSANCAFDQPSSRISAGPNIDSV